MRLLEIILPVAFTLIAKLLSRLSGKVKIKVSPDYIHIPAYDPASGPGETVWRLVPGLYHPKVLIQEQSESLQVIYE